MNHFDIMKTCHQNEKDRVLALARERADNLEESARLLRVAVEGQDLLQISRISRTFDADLSARATSVHGNLQMIAGFEAETKDAVADGDDRCYCESLAHQRKPGPCKVCQRNRKTVP